MITLACQEKFAGGSTLAARIEMLSRYDVDAVELRGKGVLADGGSAARAVVSRYGMPVSAICMGYRGALLASDRQQRRLAVDDLRTLLEIAEDLDAAGVVVVLADSHGFASPGPVSTGEQHRLTEMAAESLAALGEFLRGMRTAVLLEPRNRYETRIVRTLADGAALVEQLSSANVWLLADLFHLNIEETDPVASLERFGRYVGYVHLAENNRRPPGQGSLDFATVFRALRRAGYSGYASLERWDDGEDEQASDLAAALRYVRRHLAGPDFAEDRT